MYWFIILQSNNHHMKIFTLRSSFLSIVFFISFLCVSNFSKAQLNAAFTTSGGPFVCQGMPIDFLDQSTGNPVTWSWDFGDGSTSTAQNPTHLYTGADTFDVFLLVTDGGANSDTAGPMTIHVSMVMITETHINPSCGNNDGSITINVTGGAAPYSYMWSNGSNTQNQTNLSAGTYWVSVIDAMGCANGQSVILQNVGSSVTLSETHVDAACGSSNGSIDLTVTGGGAPFTYIWNNSATTEDINSLAAGIYDVTVTENGGCTSTQNVIVANINGPTVTETHANAICGNTNGSIDITVTGGVSPYSYIWNNSATTEDLSNLSPGNYTVTVTDQNLCAGFQSVTVIDSNVLVLSPATQSPTCGNHGSHIPRA